MLKERREKWKSNLFIDWKENLNSECICHQFDVHSHHLTHLFLKLLACPVRFKTNVLFLPKSTNNHAASFSCRSSTEVSVCVVTASVKATSTTTSTFKRNVDTTTEASADSQTRFTRSVSSFPIRLTRTRTRVKFHSGPTGCLLPHLPRPRHLEMKIYQMGGSAKLWPLLKLTN